MEEAVIGLIRNVDQRKMNADFSEEHPEQIDVDSGGSVKNRSFDPRRKFTPRNLLNFYASSG